MDGGIVVHSLEVGSFLTNCYIVGKENSSAFIIDPGDDAQGIKQLIKEHSFRPEFIINTHGHIDHIKDDPDFGLEVFIHSKDEPLFRDTELNLSQFLGVPFKMPAEVKVNTLEDNQLIEFLGQNMEIIHTPGHTEGCICIKLGRYLFSGDTLFSGSVGRTDFKGGSHEVLIESIKKKLCPLDDDLIVLPGHGPRTTIGEEKKTNPFLE